MSFLTINKSTIATDVAFDDSKMKILLEDGREFQIPLEWFPKLRNASLEQLSHWRLIGNGEGIHWEDLDEDLSVEKLIK